MATTLTVNRMQLGQEIRYLIEEVAKISQAAAGELIRVGQSRIGNVINGEGTLKYAELSMLLDKISALPNVDPKHAAAIQRPDYLEWLNGLVKSGAKRGFWQTGHLRAIHEEFRRWVVMEQRANLLRLVGSEVLPDIVQTEEYMRALFSRRTEDFDATFDDFVQARLKRQEVVDSSTECLIVMSESCLHAEPANQPDLPGAEVMQRQIAHMIDLSKRSNVTLQVMPFKVQAPRGTRAACFPFQLARVPSQGLAGPLELAYFRSPGALHYVDDKAGLTEYERTWARLTAAALSPDETRKFLRYISDALYR